MNVRACVFAVEWIISFSFSSSSYFMCCCVLCRMCVLLLLLLLFFSCFNSCCSAFILVDHKTISPLLHFRSLTFLLLLLVLLEYIVWIRRVCVYVCVYVKHRYTMKPVQHIHTLTNITHTLDRVVHFWTDHNANQFDFTIAWNRSMHFD